MAQEAEVLVVMPHPDDAEFGAAGTVARWTKEGKVVVFVVCTNGDKGTSDRSMSSETLARIRREEQVASAALLGVREVIFLNHPDQGLEETAEFRKEIVHLIRAYRPHTVVSVDPYRRYVHHRDHRITGQVVLDAVFPYARDHLAYPDLLAKGFEPHKVREVLLWGAEEPNYHSDITQTFPMKVAALRCHDSQVGSRFPELEERLRKRAAALAEGQDFELAEAFYRVELM